MNNYDEPIFVAELCCNHMGSIDIAKIMIDVAKNAGINYVKFQKRDVDEWVKKKPTIYKSPHPNPINAFGKTYEEHRKFLEFTFEQHKELKEYCDLKGINYTASVWDIKSAKEICSLNPQFIKIASACNNNYELLKWICDNYKGDIHLSVGMTSKEEIDDIVNFFTTNNRAANLYLYACTSGYPVEYKDMCILEISYLKEKYGKIVKGIGFSGHHIGTSIDIAAYTLGAKIIERHFTIDKTLKGTDQKIALTKDEFIKLIKDIHDVKDSLTYKTKPILDIEKSNKEKLKW